MPESLTHRRLLAARLWLAVACLLLAARATLAADAMYAVRIEAPAPLKSLLAKGLQIFRWQNDPQMTPELLRRLADQAVAEARAASEAQGYFSARVSVRVDEASRPWQVVLSVEPGPLTRVASVDLRFSGPVTEAPDAQARLDAVRAAWPLRVGEPFTEAAWEAAKREALRTIAASRYAAARLASSEAYVEPQAHTAALRVEIASGPVFHFGPTVVTGAQRYPAAMVRSLSPAKPGAVYDRQVLALYERRLMETGYFVSAQATLDADPAHADAAPVRMSVIEANTKQVEAGLSYSTDVRLGAQLRYHDMDLFDSAWRLRDSLDVNAKTQTARVDFDSPPRAGGRWRNAFAQIDNSLIQDTENTAYSVGVSQNWGLGGSPSSLYTTLTVEQQRVAGLLTDNTQAVFFGYRRAFRDTDSWVAPRRGYLGEFSFGGAPAELASRQFLRATASAQLFVPLGRDNDLLLRGQAGAVLAGGREGIPSSFLFRTGGDQTIRGYGFDSLGVDVNGAVVGGRRLAVGSVEAVHWLNDSWGIAAFVDAGNAWDTGGFSPVVGYGAGPRFRTPVGPIRVDLAYGQRVHHFRLHFSVGFTF